VEVHPAGKRTAEGLEKLSAYEVLVEATGDLQALDGMLHYSAPSSSLLLLGLPYAKREFSFESVVAYDKTIVGSVGSSAREFREAIDIVPRLDLRQFAGKIFPLEEFREAWEESRSRRCLKVLLEVDGSLNARS
jgi:threonine dehydrogenase-like Zn-dependent dehydrogenase